MWSTVATAFKLSLEAGSPLQLLWAAQVVALVILAAALQFLGLWPALRRAGRRQWRSSMLLGLLNPTLYYWVLFAAYAKLPAQIAQPLNCTWSVVLPLMAMLVFKQSMTRFEGAGLAVSYAGVVLAITRGESWFDTPYDAGGIALALGSTLIWATYWLACSRDVREPALLLFMNLVCGMFWTSALMIALGEPPSISTSLLAGGIWVGVFEMGLAFICWLLALRAAESPARISQVALLSPVLSPLWIALVLHEELHPASIAGLALIVCGVVVSSRPSRAVREQ